MTLEQLKELQQLSYEWSRYSGFNKKSDIETLFDLNKEIQEAWDLKEVIWGSQSLDFDFDNNFEDAYLYGAGSSLESELADIFLILVRCIIPPNLKYVISNFKLCINEDCGIIENVFTSLLCSDNCNKLASLMYYCDYNNIGLYSHVKLKLQYNYTREEYKK